MARDTFIIPLEVARPKRYFGAIIWSLFLCNCQKRLVESHQSCFQGGPGGDAGNSQGKLYRMLCVVGQTRWGSRALVLAGLWLCYAITAGIC